MKKTKSDIVEFLQEESRKFFKKYPGMKNPTIVHSWWRIFTRKEQKKNDKTRTRNN